MMMPTPLPPKTILDLAIDFARGKLDAEKGVGPAKDAKAWGDPATHLRAYGDKQALIAYDEATSTDNRGRINAIIASIAATLGIDPNRYWLRGVSPDDKNFWLIEWLRLQDLAKELVSRGRNDLLIRLVDGWTVGDFELAADFIETDKVFKGPVSGAIKSGDELKPENFNKVMFDHRSRWRPILETYNGLGEGWKTLNSAAQKAGHAGLSDKDKQSYLGEKTLIEGEWVRVVLDHGKIRWAHHITVEHVRYWREDGTTVWNNPTFWAVCNTPDLEYYITRFAVDKRDETKDGVWARSRQLDLAASVGQSKDLIRAKSDYGITFDPQDPVRQKTILNKIAHGTSGSKIVRGIHRGVADLTIPDLVGKHAASVLALFFGGVVLGIVELIGIQTHWADKDAVAAALGVLGYLWFRFALPSGLRNEAGRPRGLLILAVLASVVIVGLLAGIQRDSIQPQREHELQQFMQGLGSYH